MPNSFIGLLYCIGIILGAALGCISTRAYYLNKHKDFISELNAAKMQHIEKTNKRELELNGTISDLLEESYEKRLEIERLSAERSRLLVRLRDPGNSSNSKQAHGNKNTGGGTDTSAGRDLSREASEFLLDLTRDADQIAVRLRLCQGILRKVSEHFKQ